jgi:hypothetical protein
VAHVRDGCSASQLPVGETQKPSVCRTKCQQYVYAYAASSAMAWVSRKPADASAPPRRMSAADTHLVKLLLAVMSGTPWNTVAVSGCLAADGTRIYGCMSPLQLMQYSWRCHGNVALHVMQQVFTHSACTQVNLLPSILRSARDILAADQINHASRPREMSYCKT